MPLVVFEISFVFLSAWVDQLANAVLEALAHGAVIDLAGDLLHVLDGVVEE